MVWAPTSNLGVLKSNAAQTAIGPDNLCGLTRLTVTLCACYAAGFRPGALSDDTATHWHNPCRLSGSDGAAAVVAAPHDPAGNLTELPARLQPSAGSVPLMMFAAWTFCEHFDVSVTQTTHHAGTCTSEHQHNM